MCKSRLGSLGTTCKTLQRTCWRMSTTWQRKFLIICAMQLRKCKFWWRQTCTMLGKGLESLQRELLNLAARAGIWCLIWSFLIGWKTMTFCLTSIGRPCHRSDSASKACSRSILRLATSGLIWSASCSSSVLQFIFMPGLSRQPSPTLTTGRRGWYLGHSSLGQSYAWDFRGFSTLCSVIQPWFLQYSAGKQTLCCIDLFRSSVLLI